MVTAGYGCHSVPISTPPTPVPSTPGALTCLIELAVSAAGATLAPEEPRSHYTVELSASFLAPATGDVVADGRVLWTDSHSAKGEAELRDEGGRLVAKGSATCLYSGQGEV